MKRSLLALLLVLGIYAVMAGYMFEALNSFVDNIETIRVER